MGVVSAFLERDLGRRLAEQRVLVWYDATRDWLPWVEGLLGSALPEKAKAAEVKVAGVTATLVPFAGSFYEVVRLCEQLGAGGADLRILVYVHGEHPLEDLSPLRELECLGGDKEQLEIGLGPLARSAFQAAGLAEGKIAELLSNESLGLRDLDAVVESGQAVSPLKPLFGSSREEDVVPLFLTREDLRQEAERKGLLGALRTLGEQGLGLVLKASIDAATLAQELARGLLVAEMRSELKGPAPVEISQISGPAQREQVERARAVCVRMRREYPDAYEKLADAVEGQLGLAEADVDPATLGRVDTFRFEERRLLQACDGWLASGDVQRALDTVKSRLRGEGFWTSLSRFPRRYAAWEACEALACLAQAVETLERELQAPPKDAAGWVAAYTREAGWHEVDRVFRTSRSLLSTLEDTDALEAGARRVFARYHDAIERMASGFVSALKASGWQVPGVLSQSHVFQRQLTRGARPVAYLLADAMRFEMGADLATRIRSAGAEGVQLEPAVAAAPTITDVGMAALLPGAERSFSITAAGGGHGVTGSIDGKPLIGVAARMELAKGVVPGLVETTMGHVLEHGMTAERLSKDIGDASVLVVRSTEIDGAGESLDPHAAEALMGSLLTSFTRAIQMLANAGVQRFVVAADHGHLFGDRRGDDMKIDPPEGGTTVDLHRRCWIGRGGSTPSACVRIAAADLGYHGTDLEIVVPKGTGVFKAGGSLAFHHGGLSLQELVIPVLSFELKGKKAPKKKTEPPIALAKVPKAITNRIFSLTLEPRGQLTLMEPLRVRVIAVSTVDGATVGQVIGASSGWDPAAQVITISTSPIDVGLQLQDDTAQELRIVVVEVGTDRTLKDTEPITVRVIQ